MPMSAQLGARYSPLPYGRRPHYTNIPKSGLVDSTPAASNRTGPKHDFLLRTSAFTILEFGFIILAALGLVKPIPLNLPSHVTLTEAKGAVTIISVVWNSFAILIAKDIVLYIFSCEWTVQIRRFGKVVPGETDLVSRITAGLVSQIRHFISNRATIPYRLAFVATLLLMVLNGLGPSAITVNSVLMDYSLTIQVANLTSIPDLVVAAPLAMDRANLIARLELLENTTYGFHASDSVLIPWPESNLLSAKGTVTYKSDVITYNYSCSWRQPAPPPTKLPLFKWVVDDADWLVQSTPNMAPIETLIDATILPMETINPHFVPGNPENSTIGFLFIGRNTTISNKVIVNLEGLPTRLISANNNTNHTEFFPVLASVLVCDPQEQISPATVTLTQGSLKAEIHPGPPVVKNIPQNGSKAIFALSLLDVTSSMNNDVTAPMVNPITRILFLTDPYFGWRRKPTGIKPLSLDQINENMNKALASAAKAFLSGYRPSENNSTFPSFKMVPTNATAQRESLALVGSKPFLVALTVVVSMLVLLFSSLVVLVRADELETFDLENITKILHIQ